VFRVVSPDLGGCMTFTGCDEVVPDLRSILRGWDIRETTPSAAACRAVLRLQRTRRGFRRVSLWVNTPAECRNAMRSREADALFGVHYDLLTWFVATQRARPCLHCAAVEFACGLVAFPNTTKAGKTTLALDLARQGHRIFCDDWLPVEQPGNLGVALGILPWLRLPVPKPLQNDFEPFLEYRRGPGNQRWMYVDLTRDELAPRGATMPVRRLVLLDRRKKGKARLAKVGKDRMLSELIEQNYARQLPALSAFEDLHGLVRSAECHVLRYSCVHQASAVLRRAFGVPDSG
jgi:hypothetical protein